MELKLEEKQRPGAPGTFLSYLYGIEIESVRNMYPEMSVLIVPLWN